MSHVNDHHSISSAVPISRKRKLSASINGDLSNDLLGTPSRGPDSRKRKCKDIVPSDPQKVSSSSTSAVPASGDLHYSASIEAFLDECYPGITHPPPSTWHSSTRHPPSFYDCLSNIWLSSGALDELNRRNKHLPKPATVALGTDSGIDFNSLPLRRGEVSADLQRFARVGGPNLTDLRGYIGSESVDLEYSDTSTSESLDMPTKKRKSASKSGPSGSKRTKSGKEDETTKTGPYDNNFVNLMKERFINEPNYKTRPKNHEELTEAIEGQRNPRPVSEVTEEDLDELREAIRKSKSEGGVDKGAFSQIEGSSGYDTAYSQLCTNWTKLLADADLKLAKPDIMDGLEVSPEIGFLRQYLDTYIVPAEKAPTLPNFFFELKGPMGVTEIATRQALHDGSLGARGIHYTRICAGERSSDMDGKACTFSGIFASGQLTLYAHFIDQPNKPKGVLKYYMYPLGSWIPDSGLEQYRQAVTAFRGLRAHACHVREDLAKRATEKLQSQVRSGKLSEEAIYNPVHSLSSLQTGASKSQVSGRGKK